MKYPKYPEYPKTYTAILAICECTLQFVFQRLFSYGITVQICIDHVCQVIRSQTLIGKTGVFKKILIENVLTANFQYI